MISLEALKPLLSELDVENDLNFDTFFETLEDAIDLMPDDVEKISEFLQTDLGISSDVEVMEMEDDEIIQLIEMLNKLTD